MTLRQNLLLRPLYILMHHLFEELQLDYADRERYIDAMDIIEDLAGNQPKGDV